MEVTPRAAPALEEGLDLSVPNFNGAGLLPSNPSEVHTCTMMISVRRGLKTLHALCLPAHHAASSEA